MDTLDESVQSIDGTSGKLMFIKKGFLFKCLMVCNDSQFPSYTKLGSLSPICLYWSPFLSEMMPFINVASTTARQALWPAGTMVPSVPQTTLHMLSYAPARTRTHRGLCSCMLFEGTSVSMTDNSLAAGNQ